MSDEIITVATTFADVASLAQGYMNRADGERLLVPLPSACKEGAGVRFVVYLEDGTPAFAGAGLCVQVSDQGGTVPAEQRYETLLDTLQFDERSRPVYDYIVAVRNAAYAQQGGGEAEAEAEVLDAELEAADGAQPPASAGATAAQEGELPDEETAATPWSGGAAAEVQAEPDEPTTAGSWSEPVQWSQEAQWSQPAPADGVPTPPAPAPLEVAQPQPWMAHDAPMPSFIPPPLPTGLLTRPARTTHWQPAPPRRPTPRPATGQFRYTAGGLPRPARPPYPDLDRSAWVQPAPRPSN